MQVFEHQDLRLLLLCAIEGLWVRVERQIF